MHRICWHSSHPGNVANILFDTVKHIAHERLYRRLVSTAGKKNTQFAQFGNMHLSTVSLSICFRTSKKNLTPNIHKNGERDKRSGPKQKEKPLHCHIEG